MLLQKPLTTGVFAALGIMLSACQQIPFIGGDDISQSLQNKQVIVNAELVPSAFELAMHSRMSAPSFSQRFAYGFNKAEQKIVVSDAAHNMANLLPDIESVSHLCVSSIADGDYLLITDGSKLISQYWVKSTPEGIKAKLLRTIETRQSTNHCAISNNKLYTIDNDFGLWQRNLSPERDDEAKILISSNMFQPLNLDVLVGGIHDNTAKLLLQRQSGELVSVNLDNLEISELSEQPLLATGGTNTALNTQLAAFASGHNLLTTAGSATTNPESVTLKFKWQQDTILDVDAELVSVTASQETDLVTISGDVADDPAIWLNVVDASRSLILGTDKKQGLRVYNLDGKEIQFLELGRLNNVDIRSFTTSPQVNQRVLAAASNRSDISIDLFDINPNSLMVERVKQIPLNLKDPYGLCVGQSNQILDIIVGDKDGLLQWWKYDLTSDQATKHAEHKVPSQTEGCVIDEVSSSLFVGEEEAGIWRFDISQQQFDKGERFSHPAMTFDIEGISIYRNNEQAYLIASSQGDDSYLIFDLPSQKFLLKFKIVGDFAKQLDGASETDGLDVTSLASPNYPAGFLVVQDGRNRLPDATQNFKIVDWQQIQKLLP